MTPGFNTELTDPKLEWTALTGGTLSRVHRHQDVVRRGTTPHTKATTELLKWLEKKAMPQVPRVLHLTETNLYLQYIEGEPVMRPWADAAKSPNWTHQLGAWLRLYHQRVSGFSLPPGTTFLRGPTIPQSDIVVCHGDLGPWNFLQVNGRLTGVIDWDLAHFGHPLDDLAMLALESVPLRESEESTMGKGTPTSRLLERIEALLEGYGAEIHPPALVAHAADCLQRLAEETAALAKQGTEPFASFVKRGFLEEYANDRDYLLRRWDQRSAVGAMRQK